MEISTRDVKPVNVGGKHASEEEEGVDQCVVAETSEHYDSYWWDFWGGLVRVCVSDLDGDGFGLLTENVYSGDYDAIGNVTHGGCCRVRRESIVN